MLAVAASAIAGRQDGKPTAPLTCQTVSGAKWFPRKAFHHSF